MHQAFGTAARAGTYAILLALGGCATTAQPTVLQGAGLGATWSVKLAVSPALSAEEIKAGVQQVDEVARQLSRWDAQSSLSR
jgi:thiamine biosynthesis lipoprotein ApbE